MTLAQVVDGVTDLDSALFNPIIDAVNLSRTVAGNAFAATLSEGDASLAVQVLGDSTGNETGEWVDLLIRDIAADYPDYEVRHYIWNSSTEVMPRVPTVIQAAPSSARRVSWSGTGASRKYSGTAITGDIDVRIKCQMSNWNDGTASFIAGHFGAAGYRGWRVYKQAAGYLTFDWSADGTNLQTLVSSGSWSMPSTAIWIRVTLDVDNGASGHDIKFYTSTDGSTYSQVGSTTTRAGSTSVYGVTSHPFEIGARANTVDPFSGSIYEVHLLNAMDGYLVAPALPEHWVGSGSTSPEPTGSPIFSAVNGSHPGAGLSYLDSGTILEKMSPNYGQLAAFISTSHNESQAHGPSFYTTMSDYITSVRSRLTGVPIVGLTQNPRVSPATLTQAQAARRSNYLSWEQPLGWEVIDTYQAFLDDSRGVAALVNSDGFHPNSDGSRVWADAVKTALGMN